MAAQKGAKPPRIVAELGRPETPEETAARKAQNSRNHRANQTMRNLIYSLIATLVLVLLLVIVVVRPNPDILEPVDYQTVAAQAQEASEVPLVAPVLPPEFTSNSAQLTTAADDVSTWYIGLLTPSNEFIGFSQGINANATWVSQELDQNRITGTEVVDGVTWNVYDYREAEEPGNLAYAMVATFDDASEINADGSAYVLFGTADTNEFRTVASSVVAEITEGAQP